MALEEITNHGDLAVGLLLEQLKDKEKLEAFLRALVGPAQELEEVAHDLDTEMRLDNAVGAQLDMIGRIVNLQRGSLSDSGYRTRLRAHIRANRSEGTPDDLLEVLRLMVASNGLSIKEYPTGAVMRIADALSEDPDAIVAELQRTRPTAVPLHLEYTLVDSADTFQFASGDVEEADAAAGLSSMRTVAVGNDAGSAAYIVTADTDIATWTTRSNPKDENLYGVATDGNDTIIAVGDDDGTDPYMIRSTADAPAWTEIDLPDTAHALRSIAYSPDLDAWVAVGDDIGAESLVLLSDNGGDTWTAQSNPDDAGLNGIVWCPSLGLWVAVGNQGVGDTYLVTSPDGINWTERSTPISTNLRSVCWSEDLGLAVAVGDSDGSDSAVITSPDGINWTERTNPKNLWLYGVCWSEVLGLFVAVGDPDTDSYIITSPDGVNWTEQVAPTNVTLYSVAAHGVSELVAVGDTDGSDAALLTSNDGETWTERTNSLNYGLYAVVSLQWQALGGAWAYVEEA